MKLGIDVVYLFGEQNEALLDLHLSMIEKHTQVPYTIYGSVNRLRSEYVERLERYPQVRICHCPETDLRRGEEHAFYLDHLIEMAAHDGATHIVTLHLDSFPIRTGWAGDLAGKLSDACVFTTIDRINTACLFFHRDFYLRYRPKLRLSVEERATGQYKQYIEECDPLQHSGIGYGFKAYQEGLSWHYLKLTARLDEANVFGLVHGDMVFHLGGATVLGESPAPVLGVLEGPGYARLLDRALAAMDSIVPLRARSFLGTRLKGPVEHLVERPQAGLQRSQLEQARRRLLEDLDALGTDPAEHEA
jgi:hypothetical protein